MPGLAAGAGRLAEHLVEDQRGHAAVHQAGRALVRRAEVEVRPRPAGGVALDVAAAARPRCAGRRPRCPRRRLRPLALNRTPYGPSSCRFRSRSVIASISARDGADLVVVDLGADRRVGELADALGERAVERALPLDLLGGHVVAARSRPCGDSRTRSSSVPEIRSAGSTRVLGGIAP